MNRTEEIKEGIKAYRNDGKCPENASRDFQKGFGLAYAAAEAKPPIDLDKFEQEFEEIFK